MMTTWLGLPSFDLVNLVMIGLIGVSLGCFYTALLKHNKDK